MTNEEKARELAHFILYDKSFESMDRNTYDKCMHMAKWKDQQTLMKLVDKAVNWLSLHAEMYGSFNYGKLNEMVISFKKAMEE